MSMLDFRSLRRFLSLLKPEDRVLDIYQDKVPDLVALTILQM